MSYIRSRDSVLVTVVNYTNLWSFRHFCLSISVILREYFAHLSKLWDGINSSITYAHSPVSSIYVAIVVFFPIRTPNKKRFATFGFVLRRPNWSGAFKSKKPHMKRYSNWISLSRVFKVFPKCCDICCFSSGGRRQRFVPAVISEQT